MREYCIGVQIAPYITYKLINALFTMNTITEILVEDDVTHISCPLPEKSLFGVMLPKYLRKHL